MSATFPPARGAAASRHRLTTLSVDLGLLFAAPALVAALTVERFRLVEVGGTTVLDTADQGRADEIGEGFHRTVEIGGWLYTLSGPAWWGSLLALLGAGLLVLAVVPSLTDGRTPGALTADRLLGPERPTSGEADDVIEVILGGTSTADQPEAEAETVGATGPGGPPGDTIDLRALLLAEHRDDPAGAAIDLTDHEPIVTPTVDEPPIADTPAVGADTGEEMARPREPEPAITIPAPPTYPTRWSTALRRATTDATVTSASADGGHPMARTATRATQGGERRLPVVVPAPPTLPTRVPAPPVEPVRETRQRRAGAGAPTIDLHDPLGHQNPGLDLDLGRGAGRRAEVGSTRGRDGDTDDRSDRETGLTIDLADGPAGGRAETETASRPAAVASAFDELLLPESSLAVSARPTSARSRPLWDDRQQTWLYEDPRTGRWFRHDPDTGRWRLVGSERRA